MDTDAEFKIEYISPSIVRNESYEFCLRYLDAQGEVVFSGYEPGHSSGGMLHFLSPEDWHELYPERRGQRDLIRKRLLEYCQTHRYLNFVELSLQRAADNRRFVPSSSSRRYSGALNLNLDLIVAVAISLLWPLSALTAADPLKIGVWYYVLVPTLVLYIGIRLDAPPPYLTAASISLAVSLLFDSSLGRPENLPLALLFYFLGTVTVSRSMPVLFVLIIGLLGWVAGAGMSSRYLCKILDWCG